MSAHEPRTLTAAILADAQVRGVDLAEHSLTVEQGLPVLRFRVGDRVLRTARVRLPGAPGSNQPGVITVHGSGYRSSRMWPRRLDGTFAIPAIVDHLLGLVREEWENPWPDPPVAADVPVTASGVHVMHGAAVLLGVLASEVKPDALVERVTDPTTRERIVGHAGKSGLTDGDLRALGDGLGLFVGRSMRFDGFDPFEPISGDIVSVLRLGRHCRGKVELRYVLLLDRRGKRVRLADPAGNGIVEMPRGDVETAWRLGALRGSGWLGTVSRGGTSG
jgi:hypothetical protein